MDFLLLVYLLVGLSLVYAILRFAIRGFLWWGGDPKVLLGIIGLLVALIWLVAQIRYGSLLER